MKLALSSAEFFERPGLTVQMTGASLVLTSAICFFAWNWQALPQIARLLLPAAGTVLSLLLVPEAERRRLRHVATLALVAAALGTGLFWTSFAQIFQSGATAQEFCLAWAVSLTPIFLLRSSALLWNLLMLLLSIASLSEPVLLRQDGAWTSHFLPLLLVSGAGCLIALLPPRFSRPYSLNAWLALPLVILLSTATVICSLCILFQSLQYEPSLTERLAGPLALAAVLLPALYRRHTLSLCGASLSLLILLNVLLFRTLEHRSPYESAVVFTAVNIGATFLLSALLPKALNLKEHPCLHSALTRIPPLTGGFFSALSLALLTLFFLSEFSIRGSTMLLAGLVYMVGGMLLWRVRGKSRFLTVLASVLVSGGSLCFHIDLLGRSPAILLAGVWAAAVLIYVLMDYAPLRFSAVFWADVTSLFTLPSLLPSGFPLSIAEFLLFFLPLIAAAAGRFPRGFLRPAAFACLFALLVIAPSLPPVLPTGIMLFSVEEKIAITIAALNLAVLLGRLLHRRAEEKPAAWEYAVLVLLLIPVWYLSTLEVLIALNLIAAGLAGHSASDDAGKPGLLKGKGDKTAVLSGLILLAAGFFLFYYLSNLSFTAKTLYTGIPGFFLFCAGLWMNRRSRSGGHDGETIEQAPALRKFLPFALCSALVVAMFTAAVADRKAILREGREMLLPLTPKDPRIFMLGDYMELTYELEGEKFAEEGPLCLPLAIDEKGIAHPSPDRLPADADCSKVPAPVVQVERSAFGNMRLRLPHRYYFEQGLAPLYAPAFFAILRCDEQNRCLLTGLADDGGRPILPPE